MFQNDSYLHHQSSVLFPFKINMFWSDFCSGNFFGRFQQEMQLWPGCFFKVYATHFLMWPPFWCNSKWIKSSPLFLNPYPFIQKSRWLLFSSFLPYLAYYKWCRSWVLNRIYNFTVLNRMLPWNERVWRPAMGSFIQCLNYFIPIQT